jgi:hypothetical protein
MEQFRYDYRCGHSYEWQKSKFEAAQQRKKEEHEKSLKKMEADNKKRIAEEKLAKKDQTLKGDKKIMVKETTAQSYFDKALAEGLRKVDEADKIRADYEATCQKLSEDRANKILGEIGYQQALADATAESEQEMAALKATLDHNTTDYAERIREYASLSGSRLTDDIKLLDGSLQLSADNIDELLDRYSDNYLMSKKIWDYWTQERRPEIESRNNRGIGIYGFEPERTALNHTLQSPEEKQKIFDTYIHHLKNCLGDVSRAYAIPDGFNMRDYMKTICGDYLKRNVPEGNGEYDFSKYKVEKTAPKVTVW